LDSGVEGVPWRISFVIAMVVIVDAIFVSTHGTMAPRKMAAATDKAVTLISTARCCNRDSQVIWQLISL
jgi:hypothetical protein